MDTPELTPEEQNQLVDLSQKVVDSTLEIIAPGRDTVSTAELAGAALACRGAARWFEHCALHGRTDKPGE